MAIVHFTEEHTRLASLARLSPTQPGDLVMHIEDADDCEGLVCAARLEMALSKEEQTRWLEFHAERPPLGKHSHLVAQGRSPETVPEVLYFEGNPLPKR